MDTYSNDINILYDINQCEYSNDINILYYINQYEYSNDTNILYYISRTSASYTQTPHVESKGAEGNAKGRNHKWLKSRYGYKNNTNILYHTYQYPIYPDSRCDSSRLQEPRER